jgi:hypothetical protein
MRGVLIAVAVVALLVRGDAARAQPSERVLIDATVFVSPPDNPGLCLPLGPGVLTLTAWRVGDAIEPRTTLLRVDGYQDDPGTHVAMQIGPDETTLTKRVAGSYHYCWSLTVDAPETERMSGAQRGAYVQTVAVRITHQPD